MVFFQALFSELEEGFSLIWAGLTLIEPNLALLVHSHLSADAHAALTSPGGSPYLPNSGKITNKLRKNLAHFLSKAF